MIHYSEMIETLVPAARAAGHAIMDVYNNGAHAETKRDGSPVTKADQDAEAIILCSLKENYPEIPVISEENTASHALDAPETFFLVDPLDGTKEFLKQDGAGAFTVNIALIEKGAPTLGIVYAPALERMFTGSARTGASENGQPIKTRSMPVKGSIALASVSHRDEQTEDWLAKHSFQEIMSIGSSLKFCLIAAAEADIYPRFNPTMEWDTAAGDAILRAAGGNVSNLDGSAFTYGKKDYRNGIFVARGKL